MRSIATALKHQRLRKTYPSGVHITPVGVTGSAACVTLTNLKNGNSFEVINYTGYLANLPAALHRDALIAGFKAAGVKVEEGLLSTVYRIFPAQPPADIYSESAETAIQAQRAYLRELSRRLKEKDSVNTRKTYRGWGRCQTTRRSPAQKPLFTT